MSNSDVDHDLRTLFSAADRILAAAEEDRAAASQILTRLDQMRSSVERQLTSIPRVLEKVVDDSADATAKRAAHLLTGHFRQANEAAAIAANDYRKAASDIQPWLTRLLLAQGVVLILQVMVLLVTIFLV